MSIQCGDTDIILGVLLEYYLEKALGKENASAEVDKIFIEQILRNEQCKQYLIIFSKFISTLRIELVFNDSLFSYFSRPRM